MASMFSLQFETDNTAFTDAESQVEVVRILRALADRIENEDLADQAGVIKDRKGNVVGKFEMTDANWLDADDDTSWD
jgi:hypothetical protein